MAENRIALVTGAAGGVGASIVTELEALGIQVIACDLDESNLSSVAGEHDWQADRVRLARLDVTSDPDWDRVVSEIKVEHGKIDLLFNVAGIMRAEWIEDTPLDDIDSILAVDLKGVILGTKYAAREMIRRGTGHIVNFSSMMGLAPGPGMSVYTGAKYGVRGFTLSTAIELKPHGIAVSLICTDRIDTGLFNFPNAYGPQAAIAYSGPPALQVDKVVPRMLRKILKKKPLILAVPRYRGRLARLSESFPHKIYEFLNTKGAQRQRKELNDLTANPPAEKSKHPVNTPPLQTSSSEKAQPDTSPIAEANPNKNTPREIDQVFAAARAAAKQLRETTVKQRLDWLKPLENHLIEQRDDIAKQLGEEAGKPALEAMLLELVNIIMALRYYKRNAVKHLKEKRLPAPPFQFKKKYTICYEPMGVVLILAPYNYPLLLSLLPAIEAFIAGNSVIIKPSDQCPLTGIWEELIKRSALPPESIQIISPPPEDAAALIDARPDHIHLTGGCASGINVATAAAKNLIPTSTELGGKDVAIIFRDADITRSIEALAWAFLLHQGQTCASIKRILVHESVYEHFKELLVARIKLHAGNVETAHDLTWEAPPLRGEETRELVKHALEHGMENLLPQTGNPNDWTTGKLQPIILAGGSISLRIWQEETWGPVLVIRSFQSESEAISTANNCKFGLGACVWSEDPACSTRVASALKVGGVSINNALGTMVHPCLLYTSDAADEYQRV